MIKSKGPEFLRFCIPIKQVLLDLGGSGRPAEVTDLVIDKMNIPESYRVCFVNVSDPSKQLYPNPANTWNPGFVTLYVINQSKYNVWYYTRDIEKGEGYKIPHLSVPRSFCATRNTKLYLVNEGMVKITIKD